MSRYPDGPVPVAFKTLGCKVNRVESDEIAAELLGRGVRLAAEDEAAVIIINTCTVTAEADAKARKAVRQALRGPSNPVVVVTGCLAALDAAGLRAIDSRVVVEADKARVADLVSARLDLDDATHGPFVRMGDDFRTRAMLKIEDGCDNFCSYCIVPHARGVPWGVPLGELMTQARRLVDSGAREIVLTGINIGRYRDGGADLADVVAAVGSVGVERLRLSSIEPPDLTERLLSTLAANRAVCPHLHVPLQSGSDEVLSRMRRKYSGEEYRERVDQARSAIDGLALTTDVIAGFPGESESDHLKTLEFVESVGFSKLHVFRYSVREGTPAARMAQVEPAVRATRAAELRKLGDELRARYLAQRVGERAEVLIESIEDECAVGTTRDYLRVRLSGGDLRTGQLVEVTLTPEMVAG